MTVETVLAGVLFAALGADDVGVLILEVDILDVPLERHLVEILVTVWTLLPAVPLLFARRVRAAETILHDTGL